jgi:hypothetical protein
MERSLTNDEINTLQVCTWMAPRHVLTAAVDV